MLTMLNTRKLSFQCTKEKLDESIIISAIESSETDFDISANGLIQLKRGKVKKRIIETIQRLQPTRRARRVSRNQPTTPAPSPSADQNQPTTTSTPLPSPTPKPKPIQTKDSHGFTFDLEKCVISGTSVSCYFTIKNNAQDRKLYIHTMASTLIDDYGNNLSGRYAKVANSEGGYGGGMEIVVNNPIEAWIRFDGLNESSREIAKLTVGIFIESEAHAEIVFRNVPLKRLTRK